ncbi:MAG: hypothetical protein ABIJ95_06750 [Pseudomonadota bacterium]
MKTKKQDGNPTRKRGGKRGFSFTYNIVLNGVNESKIAERSPEQRWEEIIKVCSNIVAAAQATGESS